MCAAFAARLKKKDDRRNTFQCQFAVCSSQFSVVSLFSFCWICLQVQLQFKPLVLSLSLTCFSLLLSHSPHSLPFLLFSVSVFLCQLTLLDTIKSLCSFKINMPHFAAYYACLPHAAISSVASLPAANQFVCITSKSDCIRVQAPLRLQSATAVGANQRQTLRNLCVFICPDIFIFISSTSRFASSSLCLTPPSTTSFHRYAKLIKKQNRPEIEKNSLQLISFEG